MSPTRELIQVSAGLPATGGGTAVVGRMIAEVASEFSRTRGLPFRLLSFGPVDQASPFGAIETFHANKASLIGAVWKRQLRNACAGLIFDHPGPARMQALLPARFRSPYLVFLYGIDAWRGKKWGADRSLAGASLVIAISEFTKSRALEHFPGLETIDVLYPALEERTANGTADDGVLAQAGADYLMIVGRMAADERYKGHDQLLTAMPRVVSRFPHARLVIVGDGDDRARLEARARALNLGDSIYFPGFVSEATLEELYRRARALVMPSSEEGFGLVYLEAMRAGKACLAARGSAAAEIIIDGSTGLLIDRESEDELVGACHRLVGEPDFAQALGMRGRRRWQERFKRESFDRRLYSYLERLTSVTCVRNQRHRSP